MCFRLTKVLGFYFLNGGSSWSENMVATICPWSCPPIIKTNIWHTPHECTYYNVNVLNYWLKVLRGTKTCQVTPLYQVGAVYIRCLHTLSRSISHSPRTFPLSFTSYFGRKNIAPCLSRSWLRYFEWPWNVLFDYARRLDRPVIEGNK